MQVFTEQESTTISVKEPTTISVKEPNTVKTYGHKTTGCKEGEYSPSKNCHKVSNILKIIHRF